MAEQLKFGDRLFLKGKKVILDNGIGDDGDAFIHSRNGKLVIGYNEDDPQGEDHEVVIKGNLTVAGTTTTVNTQETEIADPFLLITSLDEDRAGIEVDIDGEINAKFGWNDITKRWETFNTPSLFSATLESTNLTSVNLSATGTSTLAKLDATEVDIESGNIDDTVIGATTPAAGKFTTITGDGTDITNVLTNYTTDDLVEVEGSSNRYFTDERVDDRINELFWASYGISATYTDPAGVFEIGFDATNIGTGEQILDTTNTVQAAFRTLTSGPNLDLTVSTDGDNIVVDTAVKINELKKHSEIGTGIKSIYTLPFIVSQDWHVQVFIDGVHQIPSIAYSITNGNTLTLAAPLALNSVMYAIRLATNIQTTGIVDADTLNGNPGSYYLDYTNFTNTPTTPTNHMVNDASNTVAGSISPSVDATHDLGTATEQWNTIYGHTVEATYADLAERYSADAPYEPGTVLVFGGEAEVTTTTMLSDTKVVGIVSTDPALKMNSAAGNSQTHPYIALKGRVPCKVIGKIEKGDLLVTSSTPGYAKASLGVPMIGTVIGKAIEAKSGTGEGIIEVFVSIM